MKTKIILILLLTITVFSLISIQVKGDSKVVVEFGTAPVLDGIFDTDEWSDAVQIQAGTDRTLYFKHDNENLYVGITGDGGNIYVLKDNKFYILHASFSLGWISYSQIQDSIWRNENKYNWELYKLQEKPHEEIVSELSNYLKKNGWSASFIPMGGKQQTEFAISMKWLNFDINKKTSGLYQITKMIVTSVKNLPREELEKKGLKIADVLINWPAEAMPNESASRGKPPENIEMDTSTWSAIYIKIQNK